MRVLSGQTLLALLIASAAASCTCGNECDFFERCNENVREVCGDGVDQMVGRKIRSTPCTAPNGACVQGENWAECVVAPVTSCDAGLPRCEGPIGIDCGRGHLPDSYLVAEDCSAVIHYLDGGSYTRTCTMSGGHAWCSM